MTAPAKKASARKAAAKKAPAKKAAAKKSPAKKAAAKKTTAARKTTAAKKTTARKTAAKKAPARKAAAKKSPAKKTAAKKLASKSTSRPAKKAAAKTAGEEVAGQEDGGQEDDRREEDGGQEGRRREEDRGPEGDRGQAGGQEGHQLARRARQLHMQHRVAGAPLDFAALRTELGVPGDFASDVLAEAEQAIRAPRLPERDATDLPLVTIDPAGSRDLDQALHIARDGDGFLVSYAIADVAAFVTPGSRARRRGASPRRDALLPRPPRAAAPAAPE